LYNNQLGKASDYLSAHIAVQSLLAVGFAWSGSVAWYWLMLGVLLLFVVGTAAEAYVSAVRGKRHKLVPGGRDGNPSAGCPPHNMAETTDSLEKGRFPKLDRLMQDAPDAKPCSDDVTARGELSPPAKAQ